MATKHHSGPVKRWVEPAADGGLDAELGDVFRALEHEEPLSVGELARVGRRLTQGRLSSAPHRRAFSQLMLAFAVLVGASGAAFAQWKRPGFWHVQAYFAPRVVESARGAHATTPAKRSKANVIENSGTALLSETPPVLETVPEQEEPALAPPSVASSSKAAARPSALARESELLQKALAKLRRDHNGPGALTLLDQYRDEFPRGELRLEASVARVDALLLSGRHSEALGLLSRLPLDSLGRASELRLVRAELYAERDCSRALPDFDAVLATAAGSNLTERALYGRAACRLRVGNTAGGRTDLETYLHRYPSGRFAEQVRARLATP